MSTNIIDITNVVIITNLEVITNIITNTNILSKIDIVDVPPNNWDIINTIAVIVSAVVMMYSVRKMAEQNKLSAESVQEMRKQYEHNEKTKHLRLLYTFVNEDVLPVLEKIDHLELDDYISTLERYRIKFNNFQYYQGGEFERKGRIFTDSFDNFIRQWCYFVDALKERMIAYKDAGMLVYLVEDKPNIKEIFREYLVLCCDLENYLYLDSRDPWADKFTALLNKFNKHTGHPQ